MKKKIIAKHSSIWQIGLFSLNNASANLYLALMSYVSYYASGIVGLSVVLISFILTGMRIFDGITDPVIAFIMDRTNGRFGRFKPFMLLGYFMLASSSVVLFFTCHLVPDFLKVPYFIVVYGIYILGFTLQTTVSKSAQSIITNDPNQRPVTTLFESIYTMFAFGFTSLFVSMYLIPKYGDFNSKSLFMEFIVVYVGMTFICTLLALIGIWKKDNGESIGADDGTPLKIHFRDYLEIIKNNRPVKLLVIAAAANKFTAMVYGNSAVLVIIFGIIMKNYAMSGLIGFITAPLTLIIIALGINFTKRCGQRTMLKASSTISIIVQAIIAIMFISFDGTTKGFLYIFIVLFGILNAFKTLVNNMVVPMIADCTDYEYARSGKFVPGLMGAMFSFVDKSLSALGTTFVGIVLAFIGFRNEFPQVDTPLTPELKWAAILMYCIVPIIGWAITLWSMKFYSLDKKALNKLYTES